MIELHPVTLENHGVRLEPLTEAHHEGLTAAASDGDLWQLPFTFVPEPARTHAYISEALDGMRAGRMLPWAVRELGTGDIVGSTRYHDIIATAGRVEIGYTWYAKRWQRTHVNTACKLLLLTHAFDTLGCGVVGLRTDIVNLASQKAIEALGARRDGVIRRNMLRRDGTVRDTVIYSVLSEDWPDVRRHLQQRLSRHAGSRRSDMTGPVTGRCLCGGVRYEIKGPFLRAGHCHCSRCRRHSGAALSTQGRVRREDFVLHSGADLIRVYRPGDGAVKAFCSVCGSSLFGGTWPDGPEISIRLGSVDGDPGIRPQYRTHVASKAPWDEILDDLPRYPGAKPD